MNKQIKNKILLSLLLPICFWSSSNNSNNNNDILISHIQKDNNVSFSSFNSKTDFDSELDSMDINDIDSNNITNIVGTKNYNNINIINVDNDNTMKFALILTLASLFTFSAFTLASIYLLKRKKQWLNFDYYKHKYGHFIFTLHLLKSSILILIQSNYQHFLNQNLNKVSIHQYFIHLKNSNP